MRKFSLQCFSAATLLAITASGGVAYITSAGGTAKSTLYNSAGAALANPVSLSSGKLEFYTADTLSTVDIYCMTPTGHFVVREDVKPGDNEIRYNTDNLMQTMVIPFNMADTTVTETSTGFTIPSHAMMLPTPGLWITAIDATETIDVGTLASASGDADGFLALASVAVLGPVKGSVIAATPTLGAYLFVLDSANAGDDAPEANVSAAGKVITWTPSAGSDTGAGFISLPYRLLYPA
jgi:hypothetical protein